MRQALHIVEDGGHEAATSYLGRKIYELQQRCVHTLDSKQQGSAGGSSSRAGVSAGSRPGAIPAVVMAGGNNSSGSVEEDLDEDAEDEEQYAGSISSGLTYPSTPGSASTAAAGGAGWGTSAPLVQFATPSRPSNPRVAAGGVLPPVASPAGAVVEVPWGLSSWQLMQGLLERTQLGQPAAVLRSLDPIKPGEQCCKMLKTVVCTGLLVGKGHSCAPMYTHVRLHAYGLQATPPLWRIPHASALPLASAHQRAAGAWS